jgi:hypothetical protein
MVLPETPTAAEELVAEILSDELKEYTGRAIQIIKDSQPIDEYEGVILVGNTKYEESKQATLSLHDREATAFVKDNKLVIAFSDYHSGKGVVKRIIENMESAKKGQFRLSLDYNELYKSRPAIDEFPQFDDATSIIDCGEGTVIRYFTNASRETLENCCAQIEACEYEKVSLREEKDNVFATYLAEDEYIYAYYSAYKNEIRIITGPIEAFAEADYTSGLSEDKIPYITSIPQPSGKAAQGFVICMPDGRFIIHDGGLPGDDRAYNRLRELQPNGDIVIAAWFISHPHGDHYSALIDFVKEHGYDDDMIIERVIHNYAHPDMYNINGSAGKDDLREDIALLYDTMEYYLPDVPVIKAHTGQTIKFGSVSVEVLYTIEDLLPKTIPNNNDSSMVIRVNIEGTSLMLLADTCYASGPILSKMWGDYLRSDIVQIAHHGMWPSVMDIYDNIQAQTVLFPATVGGVRDYIKPNQPWADVMNTVLNYAKDIYVAEQCEIIEFPYVVKNNKQEKLDYINNR